MRAPWRKTNPVGPETGFIVADPEDRPRAQRDAESIQSLEVQLATVKRNFSAVEVERDYWKRMYYSILTIREAFEQAVEATGWVEVSTQEMIERLTQEEVGVITPIATQEYPPNEGRPIPNSPDYLGECPPLSSLDNIRLLHSYHEGPGL